jgi:hypothetical protein
MKPFGNLPGVGGALIEPQQAGKKDQNKGNCNQKSIPSGSHENHLHA